MDCLAKSQMLQNWNWNQKELQQNRKFINDTLLKIRCMNYNIIFKPCTDVYGYTGRK